MARNSPILSEILELLHSWRKLIECLCKIGPHSLQEQQLPFWDCWCIKEVKLCLYRTRVPLPATTELAISCKRSWIPAPVLAEVFKYFWNSQDLSSMNSFTTLSCTKISSSFRSTLLPTRKKRESGQQSILLMSSMMEPIKVKLS